LAQRNSGYQRLEDDAYYTPPWCTWAMIPFLPSYVDRVWEPAAGPKRMISEVLKNANYAVRSTDLRIGQGLNFLKTRSCGGRSIITNPPYKLAEPFIEHALVLTAQCRQAVAMLLRVDFDSAITRRHLFKDHPAFLGTVVLMRRVRWIANSTGSPSENHTWFLWDWRKPPQQKPIINYGK